MLKNINFFCNFNEITDFIPFATHLKQCTRNKYQLHKHTAFQLHIITYAS